MKKIAYPLLLIGLIIFLRGIMGIITDYEDLAAHEGWGLLAMMSITFYGVIIIISHFLLMLIFKRRTNLLIVESVLAIVGIIILMIQ
ncbi:MAG: hypothetical protein HEP71_08470 [Roseivirga sp.]|nr:hypothetical protein [Roseivirga sp.]